jgi:arylsulfatase A-like enzyme
MLGLDRKNPFEEGEVFPCDHKKDKRVIRRRFQSDPGYAAMVQSVDEGVGRIMRALEEKGIADNTVIFFTSDNGGLSTAEGSPTCNAPLSEGKGWMYEGGTREPLIVRWPGVTRPDSFCTVPVTSTDFYPTMLEMGGLDPIPEQHVDGVSIVPLLRGQGTLDRDAIYWHYPHYSNQGGTPGCAIRAGDWKLIEFFEDNNVELYNLRRDVGEEHDMAVEKPDLVERLRGKLHQWLEDVDARIPEPNPDYE